MKKRKLEAEINFEFLLLGVISDNKEYKLAWFMNRLMNIQLVKSPDITFQFLKSQNLIISNYCFETENSNIQLLKNKSLEISSGKSAFLMPELQRFDYLILVRGFEDAFTIEEFKVRISSIPNVQYVQLFEVENLKSKENLIY